MPDLKQALGFADEAYLTALGNKGLYKRALRELPDTAIGVDWGEDGVLTATFPDGVKVVIRDSLNGYDCSCPARGACKHVLMAILAAKEAEGDTGTAEEEPLPDFSFLAELTPGALEKLGGKRQLREAAFRLEMGSTARLEEGTVLTVVLDSGHTVRFLPGGDLTGSTCSCKSGSFCPHRLEAVLQVIKARKGVLPPEFLPQEQEEAQEFNAYALPHIKAYLLELLSTGLARLPQDAPHRMEQLAVILHSRRLAEMERLCSRAQGQFTLFFTKNAGFRRDRLVDDLCRLLQLCHTLEGGRGNRSAVGSFRGEYRPLPPCELHGLGAYAWHSDGGYTGVTLVFFRPGPDGSAGGEICTFTSALPDSAKPKPDNLYHGGAPWKLPTKLASLSRARLSLIGGKISARGQLSSTEAAAARSLGSSEPSDPALASLRYHDFAALLEAVWRLQEEGGDQGLWAIVEPARMGAPQFDQAAQRLSIPVYDGAEHRLTLAARYEPCTRLLLENLEDLAEEGPSGPLLVRVTLGEGGMTAFPVAHYGRSPVVNLGLDREKKPAGSGRKSKYNWGV